MKFSDENLKALEPLLMVRNKLFYYVSFTSGISVSAFGLMNLINPRGTNNYLGLVTGLCILVNMLVYRYLKFKKLANIILLLLINTLVLYLFFSPAGEITGRYFIILLPVTAILLLGRTAGLMFVIPNMIILSIPAIFKTSYNYFDYYFNGTEILYLEFGILIITLLAFFYEEIVQNYFNLAIIRNKELAKEGKNLKADIEKWSDREDKK